MKPTAENGPNEDPQRDPAADPNGPAGAAVPPKSTRLSALEIHENLAQPAKEDMERPAVSLLFSSLAAGLVIGFSFLAAAYAASIAPARYAPAAAAAAYPLGFIFVVLGRSELFTENTLEPVVPLLEKRSAELLWETLRLWTLLLAGNLVGAAIFALALAHTSVVDDALRPALDLIAHRGTEGGFGLVFYRGIFAGWLLALLTWLLAATRATGAQIALIWLTTAPIAAFDLRHSIAGAVEAFYLAATGAATWPGMAVGFIAPAVLGNAVGGVVLVALLNYGQVAPQAEVARRRRRLERLRRWAARDPGAGRPSG